MNKKPRYISLKMRIVFSTLIPVIISFVFISIVNYVSLFNSINEKTRAEFLQTSQKYAASFEIRINNAINYLSIIANTFEMQIEMDYTDREVMQKKILDIFSDYECVDSSSVYFEPDMYDGKDAEYIGSDYGSDTSGRISWYFYTSGNEAFYRSQVMEDDVEFGFDTYVETKHANKSVYTDPSTYNIDGIDIPMFSISYPIHNYNNDFVGTVSANLFLETLYNQLKSEQIYETGYMIISNDRERIIYSPRVEDIGKTREEIGIQYSLLEGDESAPFFNAKSILNGETTLVTIEPVYIPHLDSYFYISIAAPVDEIDASGMSLVLGLVIVSIIMSIAIALLLFWLIGKISAPIQAITENANKIARGDYQARIEGDYSGEFEVVKKSVNMMADSIESYIEESKGSLDVLKNILNGLDAFIYVTIPDTGEILFINENMQEHFGIEGDVIGKLCYEVLQDGFKERCIFCPCHHLDNDPDITVVWEEHNTVTKRYYRNTDCYINWHNGNKVHLQHSVDITDIKVAMDDKLEAERAALVLKHEKEKALDATKAKNDFLAKMSHEIRTPMNAVMGMSEIMLRKELPQDVYENALGIKNASNNLLSIINDILDFSKIESGMLEITETNYTFSSLINDVIGIIRVRLIDKPIQFIVDVEPDIPEVLIGDEIRIRQTLINLLSNAVKYTNEGHILLTVKGDVVDDSVLLTVDITDSGIGVKEDDLLKLFGDFVQVDAATNRGVEGTGLGLAISRNLCRLMGGDITVRSEYGVGSTFTATFPQKIESHKPFASVNNPEDKSILIYETRPLYQDSLALILKRLGADYLIVENIPSLFDNLEKYQYIFVSSFMYGSINPTLQKLENNPQLILISDVTESMAPKDARILSFPATPLSVANILNGAYDNYNTGNTGSGANFIAPEAKILIVDDVKANLKVAEGLMLPYDMQITLCASGQEAIGHVSYTKFDLVFMDHMMPGMDGIEATKRIREMEGDYFTTLPIIALTANAISGVREMFIQNGMNDFLSKPIETAKLDGILDKWLPKEKKMWIDIEKESEEESDFVKALRSVPELSVDKALSVVGDSQKNYERIVRISTRLLPENIERLNALIDTDLPNYAIEAHGIKGVLNSIGAYRLGKTAFELEESSKHRDIDNCKSIHPEFIERLVKFSNVMAALINEDEAFDKVGGDTSLILEALPELEEAIDFYDNVLALKILEPINKFTYGQIIDKILEDLSDAVERFDFDKALALVNELKGRG